jgi:3-oxoacyl-[acyl-carrier-protein] synthase-3
METMLDAVAAYLPDQSVSLESLQERLCLSDTQVKMYRRFYGLSHVLRAPGATHAELLLAAADKLDRLRGREHLVRYVLYARALPTSFPYGVNPVHEVKAALGLDQAMAFSLTQHACAMGILGVELAGRLLAADGDPAALALVLTGEPAFTPSVEQNPGTTIVGEGAAAVLVRHGSAADGEVHDRVLGFASRTLGEFNSGLSVTDEMAERYLAVYTDTLAEVIESAVQRAGLDLHDVALVLPHNVNRVSWVRVAKRLGVPVERIFLDNVPATGHCFSADPFLNHQRVRELGLLQPGQRYVMAAVGRGSTFSALVLEH